MNKTQLLSDTENLIYLHRKVTNIMKQVTWYSNDGTLVLEMENNGNNVFSMLHSSGQLHNTYTTAP